ncbi:hypothetical protein [Planomicrobium sp. CPCC 101110]|uniref:hypothetical protein n=1 Tax=Planomicrobium sp. CPCC 101110 TaxID=2599619 RepID=UPI0011B3D256|nr:hypothetical protein [Planomicrobium sp. CPCC 101110]TWT25225.1 hypothetical protein FQV30_12715 [Planomicrobium sp. CPCC 101110]
MKPDASAEHGSSKRTKENKTEADKAADRAQKFMGINDGEGTNSDAPFQNAPDEDEADVPKGDKIIKTARRVKKPI